MNRLNIFNDAVNENGLSRCVAIILNEHALLKHQQLLQILPSSSKIKTLIELFL